MNDDLERNFERNFKRYMRENPHYFQSVFPEEDSTIDSAWKEVEDLGIGKEVKSRKGKRRSSPMWNQITKSKVKIFLESLDTNKKICTKCKKEKFVFMFCEDKKTKNRLSVWCRDCHSESYRNRGYYYQKIAANMA